MSEAAEGLRLASLSVVIGGAGGCLLRGSVRVLHLEPGGARASALTDQVGHACVVIFGDNNTVNVVAEIIGWFRLP